MHTAGVEVWFDRNELAGGDAWDAKIRQQIKECVLFVPGKSREVQWTRLPGGGTSAAFCTLVRTLLAG